MLQKLHTDPFEDDGAEFEEAKDPELEGTKAGGLGEGLTCVASPGVEGTGWKVWTKPDGTLAWWTV